MDMHLEGSMLSETSQEEEDKYHIISFTRGIKKKTKKHQVYRYREENGGCQR